MSGSPPSIIYNPSELLKRYDPENKLERYYQLLLQENKRVNLVSRETGIARFIDKDSFTGFKKLAAQSLLPLEKLKLDVIENYLDIGSGGGFPAIPILLTRRINQTCLLIERTQKKAGALRRILLALDLKATIISQPFEELSLDPVFDLITLRLVKLTLPLFQEIYSVLRPAGFFVYYGTPDFNLEAEGVEFLTYYYSTTTGESSGSFTVLRKKA